MPNRVQALHGFIIAVVAALTHGLRPTDEGSMQALLHLLSLLVQLLLEGLDERA